MRKIRKACPAIDGYSKEETCPSGRRVYLAIELWQENGLFQSKNCFLEKLSMKTFSYCYRKYKKEKGLSVELNKKVSDTFIPSLTCIPPIPVRISPEQILTSFAHFIHQLFQLGVSLVANGFRFVLFRFVAIGCWRQVGHFVDGSGSSIEPGKVESDSG